MEQPSSSKNKGAPKLIGQGTYGCVYLPPLCLDDEDEKSPYQLVGKLTTSAHVKDEIRVARLLKNVSGSSDYFALLTGRSCKPVITPEIREQCELLPEIISSKEDQILSYSAIYGGKALDGKEHLSSIDSYESLVKVFIHLLEALQMLDRLHIFHGDIKLANIVIDEAGITRLIDFGLSRISDSPRELLNIKYDWYDIYPLWFNVFLAALDKNKSETEEDVISHVKSYQSQAAAYVWKVQIRNETVFEELTAQKIIDQLIRHAYVNSYKYFTEVIVPNTSKVDLYSLTIAMNRIWKQRRDMFTDVGSVWEKKFKEVVKHIFGSTANPALSYTVGETIRKLRD